MTGLSGTGMLSTSYTGGKPLVITAANSVSSDLGWGWQGPTVDTLPSTFNFAAGKALLIDMKFTGIPTATGGDIQLIVNDTVNNISGSLTIKNTLNVPGHLTIRRGAVTVSPEVTQFLQFPATQRELVYGHIYDRGGNWLRAAGPADAPVWLYESATSVSPMAARAGIEDPAVLGVIQSTISNIAPVNFNPQDATVTNGARLRLNVVADSVALVKQVTDLTVTGSTAASFEVIPESNDVTWAATDCFRVTVRALDGVGNLAPLYVGAKTLTWGFSVALTSASYPTFIGSNAGNELPEKSIVKLANGTYTFGGGVFEAPFASFCLRDATNIGDGRVRITVTDTLNSITGSVDITVTPGPAAKYGIAENIVESKVVCDAQTIVAGTNKSYYLQQLDAAGNFLSHIRIPVAKWTPLGDFLAPGTLAATGDGNDGAFLSMTKTGIGILKFDFPGPSPAAVGTPQVLHCNPTWNIVNSLPNELVVTNQNGLQGEFATEEFTAQVQVLDQHGNVHVGFSNTTDLRFTAKQKANTLLDARDGLLGDRPKLAGVATTVDTTVSVTFVNGLWQDASKKFNFPLSDSDVRLNVAAPLTTLLAGYRDIAIKAGPSPERLQIRSRSDRSGVITDSVWTAAPANAITTVGNKTFFTVLADSFGNYMSATSAVTWSLPNGGTATPLVPLAASLTPDTNDAGAAVYNPVSIGDGTIEATYTPGTLTTNVASTGEIIITQAPAVKWRITEWKPTGTEAALDRESGVPFTISGQAMRLKFEALDAEDTVVTGFTNPTAAIAVMFEGSTPAALPFTNIPQLVTFGDVLDSAAKPVVVSFVDGVGFAQVILYNQDDRVRFTVSGQGLVAASTPEVKVKPDTLLSLQVRYPLGFGDTAKTIKADEVLPVEVVGVDNYGNKIGNMLANLSTVFTGFVAGDDYDGYTGFDSYDQFVATLSPPSVDGTNKVSIFQPVQVGRGKIFVDCTDPRCTTNSVPDLTTAAITVDPGAPKRFVVEVKGLTEKFQHGDGITPYSPPWFEPNYIVSADAEFDIRVMAVDIFGNQVKTYAGGNSLAFAYDVDGNGVQNAVDDAALLSPKSNAPTTVLTGGAGTTVWTFTNGVWRSIDKADPVKMFKLKRATKLATEKPYLVVKDTVNNLEGRTSERLDVLPSALNYIAFMDEASNAGAQHGVLGTTGQEICPAGVCPTTVAQITMQTGDTRRLYTAGFDVEGNYRSDNKVDWSLTSTANPLPGRTNAQSLSACIASGAGVACATGLQYAQSFFSEFTPETIGDYDIQVTALDGLNVPVVPAIKSQMRVTMNAGSATKFKAYVVYDENADQVSDSVMTGAGTLGDPVRVTAGKCFRIKIDALDSNNNTTNYSGTPNLDFFSDAPEGPTGFKPTPFAAPVLNTLTFVNGSAWSAINPLGTHACAQTGKLGSFQFMMKSVPVTQNWFIRVSDGAGTGLDDDEVRIAVDPGAVDFVAMMAGNPATPDSGIMVGNSRTSTVGPNAIDMTNSGNWTEAIPCTSIDEILGKCNTFVANQPFSSAFYRRTAGQAPAASINYHRFYIASFDVGGNLIGMPAGDWSDSKVTMGEVPAASPQWTTPKNSILPFSNQYLKAEGLNQTDIANNYSSRIGDTDISNTSAIFYYPVKIGGGRIVVKNILAGGVYYYLNTRSGMYTSSKPLSSVYLAVNNSNSKYLAGDPIAIKVSI